MCVWSKLIDVVSDYGVKSAHVNGVDFIDDKTGSKDLYSHFPFHRYSAKSYFK